MKLAALVVGTALALVPTGTAVAGETGEGKAYGNCRNSSAGGMHTPLLPEVGSGRGNGGLQSVRTCLPKVVVVESTDEQPTAPVLPPVVVDDGFMGV